MAFCVSNCQNAPAQPSCQTRKEPNQPSNDQPIVLINLTRSLDVTSKQIDVQSSFQTSPKIFDESLHWSRQQLSRELTTRDQTLPLQDNLQDKGSKKNWFCFRFFLFSRPCFQTFSVLRRFHLKVKLFKLHSKKVDRALFSPRAHSSDFVNVNVDQIGDIFKEILCLISN